MPGAALANMWMPSLDDLARLSPLFSLTGTIVAILVAAIVVGRNWRVTAGVTAIGSLLTAWLAYQGWKQFPESWAGMVPPTAAGSLAPMLLADQAAYFLIFLLGLFLLVITGMWWLNRDPGSSDRPARQHDAVEFFVLLVGSALGMAMMVSTTNLLMIILAIEMASLPSYGLVGFRKNNRLAAEASLKYILFGAVTSAIMIYGASLLYGRYQTLDLAALGQGLFSHSIGGGSNLLLGVGLVAFLIGALFKISAVPFHFWCPDAFEGASVEITTWLSVASKGAGLALLLRVLTVLIAPWQYPAGVIRLAPVLSSASVNSAEETLRIVLMVLGGVAALTCTIGNFAAYHQTNLKRLFAFSSIAHAGYMLMAAVIVFSPAARLSSGNVAAMAHPAFSAFLSYITVYLLMNVVAFGCVAMVYWATGKETLEAFNGLIRRSPFLAVAMVICLFSLVGMPPLGGFMAKWYLLWSLYDNGALGILLVGVAVANTLFSLYYYARVAYAMCFVDDGQPSLRTPLLGRLAVGCAALLILLTGTLWAGRLKGFADNRSRNLYAVQPVAAKTIAAQGNLLQSPELANLTTARP